MGTSSSVRKPWPRINIYHPDRNHLYRWIHSRIQVSEKVSVAQTVLMWMDVQQVQTCLQLKNAMELYRTQCLVTDLYKGVLYKVAVCLIDVAEPRAIAMHVKSSNINNDQNKLLCNMILWGIIRVHVSY